METYAWAGNIKFRKMFGGKPFVVVGHFSPTGLAMNLMLKMKLYGTGQIACDQNEVICRGIFFYLYVLGIARYCCIFNFRKSYTRIN